MISHAVGGHLVVPIGVGHGTSLPLVQKPQLKQGSIFSKQVRVVCRIHCNNGWMDKLERTAKLHLLPLVSGHNHNIDRISQTILARWFAKTTMTAEYIYRGEILIPREQRTYFMETQEPPQRWQIWITSMRSAKYMYSLQHFGVWQRRVARLNSPDMLETVDLQITLIGLGNVLAHIFSTSSTTTWLDPNAVIGSPFTQIWPIVHDRVSWPSRHAVSDLEIDRLAIQAARLSNTTFIPH
jgi:hypothetical protein